MTRNELKLMKILSNVLWPKIKKTHIIWY